MGLLSPIRSITPISRFGDVTGPTITDIPSPVAEEGYIWTESDISGKNAGRNEAMVMNKARKGKAKSVKLLWRCLALAEASKILQAFDSEYLQIELLDPKAGGWITRKFYVGDREGVSFNSFMGFWSSVGFTIIQQDADPG